MADMSIVDRIVAKWGGKDAPSSLSADGKVVRFVSSDGGLYEITLPGGNAKLREDSGRPFRRYVKAGEYLVNCLTDAPDCWWIVRPGDV